MPPDWAVELMLSLAEVATSFDFRVYLDIYYNHTISMNESGSTKHDDGYFEILLVRDAIALSLRDLYSFEVSIKRASAAKVETILFNMDFKGFSMREGAGSVTEL